MKRKQGCKPGGFAVAGCVCSQSWSCTTGKLTIGLDFSLPTFIEEWTKLDLRSHGELNIAVAVGIVAQTAAPWDIFNWSLGYSFLCAYSCDHLSVHESGQGEAMSILAQKGKSWGRNGWFSWKIIANTGFALLFGGSVCAEEVVIGGGQHVPGLRGLIVQRT